ncbi:MAG: hypothetical protein M1816_000313 [Peltula sp. TS41687]|nr:MAG: hypothetical protein M1816_000313 [Peltula sp. TS41687]
MESIILRAMKDLTSAVIKDELKVSKHVNAYLDHHPIEEIAREITGATAAEVIGLMKVVTAKDDLEYVAFFSLSLLFALSKQQHKLT